ncbi:hypothetical protein KFK09_022878 [Dendrobium nobile]|uniref:Uncharacterized protein n=1 Tax=Dendrobium nobile TaxID=94219 RepID=A0A8T3AKM0_DENNO|nr:hypothetical protein KFK09_022878 [Dendrobium nobile]
MRRPRRTGKGRETFSHSGRGVQKSEDQRKPNIYVKESCGFSELSLLSFRVDNFLHNFSGSSKVSDFSFNISGLSFLLKKNIRR